MKLIKTTYQISFIFLLSFLFFSSISWAQKGKKIEDLPDNCEIMSLKLDGIGTKFNKFGKEQSNLIIIGISQKKENSRYNDKRILDAIKYLAKFHNITNEKIVYGTRPTSNELYSLKFYINGEFVDEIKTVRKGGLCFGMGETF